MNKLRALCEKWQRPNINIRGDGGEGSTDISYSATRLQCAAELRAILPDVERLETEVANLKAHREKFEKTNGELTDYAYLCKLEGQVERLVEALREALEDAMRKPSNYAWVEKAEHVLSVGEERKER